MNSNRVCLVILDGWGHGPNDKSVNAILSAKTPFIDSLYHQYPNSELLTCGEHVGLPDGQMGNSEVGHLNIGAGRVVYQQLLLINKAFKEKTVWNNETLLNALAYAKEQKKKVHLIGLVSNGGIHSHIDHFTGLLDFFAHHQFSDVFVHASTDGRDTDPKSGVGFLEQLENRMQTSTGKLASVIGRYYSMDRDLKWDRLKLAYDLMVNGVGLEADKVSDAMRASYADDVTDEFIKPMITTEGKENGLIEDGDVVINVNFRTDRGRQISRVLTQEDFPEFNMSKKPLHYITLTEYDATFKDVRVMFHKKNLTNTLGEVIQDAGKTQLRIAETEKYPHVTFFFSGGRETVFDGEDRIMAQSPKVATYDLAPKMSADKIAKKVNAAVDEQPYDLIILNFANADMVGHTGVFSAVEQAVEETDLRAKEVVTHMLEKGYTCLVTADHGNADFEVNEDGSPNTAHTTNPVPLFLVGSNVHGTSLKSGKLADIAPTILHLMGIDIPSDMTGEVLVG